MPDMTLVPMAYCTGPKTLGPFTVPGSNGKTYTVRFGAGTWEGTCTCPAFVYSKSAEPTCKHIVRVQTHPDDYCGWGEQWGEAPVEDGTCPRCGGPTTTYLTAT